jgi:exopolyphosphatase/guanosine-5'-triphosphate,3'-diphosphate pyrophosphatase
MLAARIDGGNRIFPLALERRITRLAGDFHDGQTLKEPAMERSLSVLKEYAGILSEFGVRSVNCGATGVVRRAENSARFLRAIRETTGLHVSILSESSEAFLSAKGTLSVLPRPPCPVVSFDLGGSSTEFLLVNGQSDRPQWETSVFIGAATLTARLLFGDPTDRGSVAAARATAQQLLTPALSAFHALRGREPSPFFPFQLVGTAGTVSTLAAMFLGMEPYEPYRINGLVLDRNWLDKTVELLTSLPIASRRQLPGLEDGREDIILGGAIIVQEILKGFHQDRLTVTDGGLLEGLLLEIAERELGWPRRLFSPLTWKTQSS